MTDTQQLLATGDTAPPQGPTLANSDLAALRREREQRDRTAQLRAVFDTIDSGKSGYITRDELHRAFVKAGKNVTPNEVRRVMQAVDTSNDGHISFDEFKVFSNGRSGPLVDVTENNVVVGLLETVAAAAGAVEAAPPPTAASRAEIRAECPISYEPLAEGKVGVFLKSDGKRVSQHFFNLAAAKEHLRHSNRCPLTRLPIASVLEVPDIRTRPQDWFRAVDLDGDGKLSRQEVVLCLMAQLPVDNTAFHQVMNSPQHELWKRFDKDGSGHIERGAELTELVTYVERVFSPGASPSSTRGPVPDIRSDALAWWKYWDEDGSGEMERDEVLRAVVKTFKLGGAPAELVAIRESIDAIWFMFDADGDGGIDEEEFIKEDGLCGVILAHLAHTAAA